MRFMVSSAVSVKTALTVAGADMDSVVEEPKVKSGEDVVEKGDDVVATRIKLRSMSSPIASVVPRVVLSTPTQSE